jgi:hypothetical protein
MDGLWHCRSESVFHLFWLWDLPVPPYLPWQGALQQEDVITTTLPWRAYRVMSWHLCSLCSVRVCPAICTYKQHLVGNSFIFLHTNGLSS